MSRKLSLNIVICFYSFYSETLISAKENNSFTYIVASFILGVPRRTESLCSQPAGQKERQTLLLLVAHELLDMQGKGKSPLRLGDAGGHFYISVCLGMYLNSVGSPLLSIHPKFTTISLLSDLKLSRFAVS